MYSKMNTQVTLDEAGPFTLNVHNKERLDKWEKLVIND